MPLPSISLVTTNFNLAPYLAATLDSVLGQGYPGLEYLVMDGGSTDGSVEIIRQRADRLAHWQSAPDGGMYDAIQAGLSRSTGEIMGWLNSDDLLLPGALSIVGEVFAQFPEVHWLTTLSPAGIDARGRLCVCGPVRGYSRAAFLDGVNLPPTAPTWAGVPPAWRYYVQQESTFWRRGLWEQVGGHVAAEFGAAGDFELWGRFAAHAELVAVTCPLGAFRFRPEQQSARPDYARHCGRALELARTRQGWRPRRFAGVRGLGRLFAAPYVGMKVTKASWADPAAPWILQEYRFR